MKSRIFSLFIVLSVILTPLSAGAASESSTEVVPDRYFLSSTKSFWKNALGARHSFEDGFTAELSSLQLRLAKFAGLKPVPVKRFTILPADTTVEKGKPTQGPKETKRATPTNQLAWGVDLLTGGVVPPAETEVTVAVLDTGVTASHPDLTRRIQECKDFTQRKDPVVDGSCDDRNGHGTHVAGIIAADGGEDALGIYGVAPEALLDIYKVCGTNGSCWSDDIAVAIYVAADAGAQVINLSLGSDSYSSLIGDAIHYAADHGTLVVAAAGNDGPYAGSIDWPAAMTDVIAVGAIDSVLDIADWSSRGINADTEPYSVQEGDIEFAAPGVNIESTYGNGYAELSGTSMAAPHIAGLAALLWQTDAENPAGATRELLHDLAQDIFPVGDDEASGWGAPVY